MSLTVLSLCAGIGGMDLGLERAGMTVVGQVEIDPWRRSVLAHHWPEVPRHDDVRTCVDWWLAEHRPPVDLIAAGFPCQPASLAGLRRGIDDERWLGDDVCGVIDVLRSEWVLIENVPGLLSAGADVVLDRLDRAGYRTRTGVASACAVGAPHTRSRLFIVAHAPREGRCARRPDARGAGQAPRQLENRPQPARGTWWANEPRVDRVAYGVPRGMDRRRGIGDAVVPQVAEHIGRLILDSRRAA